MAINKNKVMDAARKARDKGQVDKAIKEYLKIVREDPKDVRVWLKIGDLYAKKGSKSEATETYLKVAKFYGEQGFYLKAVAVYKQILKLDPRLVEVNLKLAELYRQLGLISDAMQHFEMVAAFFHREGKTREALATIRQLVDLDPENVATRIKLAELYSKEGLVEDAVSEFSHACDYLRKHNRLDDFIKVAERLLWHKPDDVALNRELATLYLRRSDPRRALQKLQTCFKSDPRDVETLGLLAQAFQALDQKGKTVSVLKEMAKVLVEVGKRREAEEVHRKILTFVPNDPDSRSFLGEQLSQARSPLKPPLPSPSLEQVLGAPAGSRRQVGRGVMNPTGSMPLVVHSQELEALGGEAEGGGEELDDSDFVLDEQSDFGATSAPEQDETDFMAHLSLDDEAFETDSSVRAEAHADEIVKILTETDVYVKYGLHQKAIDHLGKVFLLDPTSREARERLKDILLQQGRAEEAMVELCHLAEQCGGQDPDRAGLYLREALQIDPDNGRALELAERYRVDLSEPAELDADGDSVQVADVPLPLTGTVGGGSGLIPGASRNLAGGRASSPSVGRRAAGSVASSAAPRPAPPKRDELDFDDLDLDSDEDAALAEAGTAYSARPAPERVAPRAVPLPRPSSGRFQSDGFEFELGDDEEGPDRGDDRADRLLEGEGVVPISEVGSGATVEVAMDQVEEAMSIAELDSDDLEFDAGPAPSSPLSPLPARPPGRGYAGADPAMSGGADADLRLSDEDLPFDPQDARMFDAEPGFDEDGVPTTGFAGSEPAGAGKLADPVPSPAAAVSRTFENPLALGSETRQEPGDDRVAGGTSLEDDLDEADFFVSQGLWEEARDILRGLAQRHPQHPLVMAKLRDVEAMAVGSEAEERPAQRFASTVPVRSARPVVLLEKPIEDSDADTHFDLGLAYKEMGLHEEAIKAFHKVLSASRREVQSHMMIGLCHREQGNLSEAINQFKAGLYVDKITTPEKFGLYYEIGNCYEDLEDPQEALYYYEMVLKKDNGYRDVLDRVAAIRAALGGGAATAGSAGKRTSTLDAETDAALDHLKR